MSDQAWKAEAAATIERLTKERDHFLSNWKDARRYLTIEIGHAEDAEARADSLAAELAKAKSEIERRVADINHLDTKLADALDELAKVRQP